MTPSTRLSTAVTSIIAIAAMLLALISAMPSAAPRMVYSQTSTADVADLLLGPDEHDPRPGCRVIAGVTTCSMPYEAGPWCGQDGKRIHAIYLRRIDRPSSGFFELRDKIEIGLWGADEILNRSAQREGRTAHFRFMTSDACELQIDHVATDLPLNGGRDAIKAVIAAGYTGNHDRTWAIFFDEKKDCGWATFYTDARPDPKLNDNNHRQHYTAISSQCTYKNVVAHELAHTMGAVLDGAPNRYSGSHCDDGRDVLCFKSGAPPCDEIVFDCGRDDYFAFQPQGSWLKTYWNTVNSSWITVS